MKKRTIELTVSELSPGGDGVSICTIDGERRAVFPHTSHVETVVVLVPPGRGGAGVSGAGLGGPR